MLNLPKKLQRWKSKTSKGKSHHRETTSAVTVTHPQEFLLRVKDGNEEEALIPIWIPLSIMAKGAAISSGANEDLGELASSVVIGHGNVVAGRQSTQQYVMVDAFGEVLMAAKISALALLQANANAEAARAAGCAVMGCGHRLLSNIYANSVVNIEDPGSSVSVAMTEKSVVRKIALADSAGDDDEYQAIQQLYDAHSVSLSEDRNRARMEKEYQAIKELYDARSVALSENKSRASRLSGNELKILADDRSIHQLFNKPDAVLKLEERDDQEKEKSKTNKNDKGLRLQSGSSFISQCGQEIELAKTNKNDKGLRLRSGSSFISQCGQEIELAKEHRFKPKMTVTLESPTSDLSSLTGVTLFRDEVTKWSPALPMLEENTTQGKNLSISDQQSFYLI